MNDAPRYATLQDYLRVLRERRLIILAVAVLAAGLALVLSLRQETRYEATARIAVNDVSQDPAVVGSTPSGAAAQTVQQRVPLYTSRVTAQPVIRKVASQLGTSPAEIRRSVSAQVQASTGFILVEGAAPDPRRAERVATTVAQETVRLITDNQRSLYAKAARQVRKELVSIPKARRGSYVYAATQQRLFGLRAASQLSEPVSLNSRASVPGAPVSPRPVRDSVLGLLFGLIVGVGLAFLRDVLDTKLRHMDEVGRELDLPVVGRVRTEVMGRFVPKDTEGQLDLHGPAWEAFSILRTNLGFLVPHEGNRVVLVTSAVPEEGKSTVSMHLAAASALAGQRTLLVDLDLRRPVLATRTDVPPTPGLTDYLLGQAEPREVLRTVSLTEAGADADPNVLGCIPAGTSTPRVPELLASQRFRDLIRDVREEYDLVILDSPPLLAVADPLQVVPVADVVLLCVKLLSTSRTQALAAREALSRAPDRPTGVVITGVKPTMEGDYGQYGYSYYTPTVNGHQQVGSTLSKH